MRKGYGVYVYVTVYAKRDHKSAKCFPRFCGFRKYYSTLCGGANSAQFSRNGSPFRRRYYAEMARRSIIRTRPPFFWSRDDRWKGRASSLLLRLSSSKSELSRQKPHRLSVQRSVHFPCVSGSGSVHLYGHSNYI